MNARRWAQTRVAALAALILACGAGGAADAAAQHQHEGHSPYAGTGSGDVKTLTPEEVTELREGAGMGLARAAELNGYPGPRHTLDLADSLDLTATQRERTRAVFAAMSARVRELGEEIIAEEAALDAAFAAGDGADALVTRVARIAELRGELRWAHLRAHLEMAEILTPHQRHEYDRLRGYGGRGR